MDGCPLADFQIFGSPNHERSPQHSHEQSTGCDRLKELWPVACGLLVGSTLRNEPLRTFPSVQNADIKQFLAKLTSQHPPSCPSQACLRVPQLLHNSCHLCSTPSQPSDDSALHLPIRSSIVLPYLIIMGSRAYRNSKFKCLQLPSEFLLTTRSSSYFVSCQTIAKTNPPLRSPSHPLFSKEKCRSYCHPSGLLGSCPYGLLSQVSSQRSVSLSPIHSYLQHTYRWSQTLLMSSTLIQRGSSP